VLSSEQLKRYTEEGYLVFEALLPMEGVVRYRAVMDDLVARGRGLTEPGDGFHLLPDEQGRPVPGRLHKVQGVCVVDDRLLKLAREPAILDRVEALIGPNIDMFGSKFFPMLYPGATSTGWHQDNHYFGTNSNRVVSCAIYLQETVRENGCLQVVPGSHRTGELVSHHRGTGTMAHGSWTAVMVAEDAVVDVVCPPGTVVLFSANLLHGALPNLTPQSSYRTAWHYVPGDMDLAQFPRGGFRDRHLVRGQ